MNSLWFFLIFSTLCWGIAEIFYKLGSLEKEKYSHLKITILVGIFMGIYATIILFTQDIDLSCFFSNFLRYLPVSLCYIVSMICSYFGVRFIEESISDPIENTSCAFVALLCAIFLHETIDVPAIICIIIIVLGMILVSVFDRKGKEERHNKYGKTLAILAICMPFCYMILDSVGTFLDIFYTDSIDTTILIGVTEETLEHTANCCYEFTFFIISIILYIFIRIKGEKLFNVNNNEDKKFINKVLDQKYKILAALFETAGQATYIFAVSEGDGIAAVILGAGTVITSLILSRIILKEKLSILQYVFISLIMIGIIGLALLGF